MVQWELDSFYFKFKNLLSLEKDATLTLKSEAGRASVTLSFDLGHVFSGDDQLPPSGPRNGPSRQRRREKRAAARNEKLSAENVGTKDVESAEEVEEVPSIDDNAAEEAKQIAAAVKVVKVVEQEAAAEKAKSNDETVDEAVRACDPVEKTEAKKFTAEKATVLMAEPKDELCPDVQYKKQEKSKPNPRRRPSTFRGADGVEYYTLTYEDPSDSD